MGTGDRIAATVWPCQVSVLCTRQTAHTLHLNGTRLTRRPSVREGTAQMHPHPRRHQGVRSSEGCKEHRAYGAAVRSSSSSSSSSSVACMVALRAEARGDDLAPAFFL